MKPKTYTINGRRYIRNRALEMEAQSWLDFAERYCPENVHVRRAKEAAERLGRILTLCEQKAIEIDGVVYVPAGTLVMSLRTWVVGTFSSPVGTPGSPADRIAQRIFDTFDLLHQENHGPGIDVPRAREWTPADALAWQRGVTEHTGRTLYESDPDAWDQVDARSTALMRRAVDTYMAKIITSARALAAEEIGTKRVPQSSEPWVRALLKKLRRLEFEFHANETPIALLDEVSAVYDHLVPPGLDAHGYGTVRPILPVTKELVKEVRALMRHLSVLNGESYFLPMGPPKDEVQS